MPIHSIIFGFGYRARSGKDTAAAEIVKQRGPHVMSGKFTIGTADGDMGRGTSTTYAEGRYDVRSYSFAAELKREVNEAAMNSGGMLKLFDDGLRMEGAGYWQTNGNILPLPEWVQYDWNAPMDDPLCPYGKQRTLLQWWGTEFRRNVEADYWVNKLAKRLEEEKPEIALITDMRFPNEMKFVQEYGEAIKVVRPGLPPVTHVSETALDSVPDWAWDFILDNDTTLEDFKDRAVKMFDYLMEEQQ